MCRWPPFCSERAVQYCRQFKKSVQFSSRVAVESLHQMGAPQETKAPSRSKALPLCSKSGLISSTRSGFICTCAAAPGSDCLPLLLNCNMAAWQMSWALGFSGADSVLPRPPRSASTVSAALAGWSSRSLLHSRLNQSRMSGRPSATRASWEPSLMWWVLWICPRTPSTLRTR